MKAIALDPDYARKSSRKFVTGGLAGHLYLNVKKWLGYRDQVCCMFLCGNYLPVLFFTERLGKTLGVF